MCNKKNKDLFHLSKFLHWGDEMPVHLEYTGIRYLLKGL